MGGRLWERTILAEGRGKEESAPGGDPHGPPARWEPAWCLADPGNIPGEPMTGWEGGGGH